MPTNTMPRNSKNNPPARNWPLSKAALTMVNSLTKGPNGGEPAMARKPIRNSAPESGTRSNALPARRP